MDLSATYLLKALTIIIFSNAKKTLGVLLNCVESAYFSCIISATISPTNNVWMLYVIASSRQEFTSSSSAKMHTCLTEKIGSARFSTIDFYLIIIFQPEYTVMNDETFCFKWKLMKENILFFTTSLCCWYFHSLFSIVKFGNIDNFFNLKALRYYI